MENKTIYIADYDHYTKVLEKVGKVKGNLWIATADIKDWRTGWKGYCVRESISR